MCIRDSLGAGRGRTVGAEVHQAHHIVAVFHAARVQRAGERQAVRRGPLAGAVHQANAGAQLRGAEDARNVRQGGVRVELKVRVRRGQVFQRAVEFHRCV